MLTESVSIACGSTAPDFALEEPLTGTTVSLQEARGEKGLLVVFMCNHCPFVIHLERGLGDAGTKARELGIGMVGISSNDVETHPMDGPAEMKKMAEGSYSTFKYLYDPTQKAALDYKAQCTPDIYLFDKDLKLFYQYVDRLFLFLRSSFICELWMMLTVVLFSFFILPSGQFDDSRPGSGRKPVTGKDLFGAMEKMVSGGKPVSNARASIGCNIKWKAGNNP